jgi:hypothetical protein
MTIFTKVAQNQNDLVVLLESRGMYIPNKKVAEQACQYFAAVVHYLLREINPNNTWVTNLKELFAKHRNIDKQTLLGFPPRWSQKTFWRF